MRFVLGILALLALCYAIADKEELKKQRKEVDRWAKPLAAVAVVLAIYLFFIYPLL